MSAYGAYLDEHPADGVRAQLWLGICLQEQQKYADSVAYLEQAATLASNNPVVLSSIKLALANSYYLQGNTAKAVPLFQTYVAAHPQDVHALISLGVCYQDLKKYRKSIAPLEAALASVPDGDSDMLKEVNSALLLSYCQSGDLGRALTLYQSLSSDMLKDPALAELSLDRRYQSDGRSGETMAIFKEVATKYPDGEQGKEAPLRVADCLWLQHKYTDAVAYLDKLAADRPDLAPGAQLMKAQTMARFMDDRKEPARY